MGFFISTIEHTSRAQNSYLINSVGPGFASHPSSISLFITRFASVGSTSNQPEVHIETHDGLELETQVGYKPDGSIVVHIHKRRPASAGRNAPSGAMLPPCKLESIILPPPHLVLSTDVRDSFSSPDTPDSLQQEMRTDRLAGPVLRRIIRLWNLRTPTEAGELDAVHPSAPPPTYEDAVSRPPPPYKPQIMRLEVHMPDVPGSSYFSRFPSYLDPFSPRSVPDSVSRSLLVGML